MHLPQTSSPEVAAENDPAKACPCCSGRPYGECCLPILDGAPAATAEALVRARYTAFAVRRLDLVSESHAPEIRDDFNRAEAERLAEECEWKGLRIQKATEEGDQAEIEFVMEIRRREKPSRCKTMPFYPYREEKNQAEFLKPREGWECDVSEAAPIVYAGREIVPTGYGPRPCRKRGAGS
jgi:uncharacterized protein YchJ